MRKMTHDELRNGKGMKTKIVLAVLASFVIGIGTAKATSEPTKVMDSDHFHYGLSTLCSNGYRLFIYHCLTDAITANPDRRC